MRKLYVWFTIAWGALGFLFPPSIYEYVIDEPARYFFNIHAIAIYFCVNFAFALGLPKEMPFEFVHNDESWPVKISAIIGIILIAFTSAFSFERTEQEPMLGLLLDLAEVFIFSSLVAFLRAKKRSVQLAMLDKVAAVVSLAALVVASVFAARRYALVPLVCALLVGILMVSRNRKRVAFAILSISGILVGVFGWIQVYRWEQLNGVANGAGLIAVQGILGYSIGSFNRLAAIVDGIYVPPVDSFAFYSVPALYFPPLKSILFSNLGMHFAFDDPFAEFFLRAIELDAIGFDKLLVWHTFSGDVFADFGPTFCIPAGYFLGLLVRLILNIVPRSARSVCALYVSGLFVVMPASYDFVLFSRTMALIILYTISAIVMKFVVHIGLRQ